MVSTILTSKPKYHFIGVGGIGMSGLAELLVRQGYRVSGSDLAEGAITRRLAELGVRVHLGHRAENLGDADVVVHSTAVKEDNPELAAARARGLKVLRRGELLAELMKNHTQVAVTGMHGKTSTTAMTAAVLRAGNLDPTVVVGSVWDGVGSNAVLGRGEVFVAESDESDGSFALLSPEITIITNLDREHLDYYRDLAHIQEMFAAYLERLPEGARVIACADDPHLAPVLAGCPREVVTYSLKPGRADFYATDLTPQGLGYRFRLWRRGEALGTVTLPLAGSHYVLNAMAACAVGSLLGLEFPAWQQGLAGLGQIHRRCQVKGEARDILVIDDYGHHPAEIRATLPAWPRPFPSAAWWWPSSPTATAAPGPCCRNFSPCSIRPRWSSSPRSTAPASPAPMVSPAGPSTTASVAPATPEFILLKKMPGRLIISLITLTPATWSSPWGPGTSGRPAKTCWPVCNSRRRPAKRGAHEEKTRAAALPPRPPAAGAQEPAYLSEAPEKDPVLLPGALPEQLPPQPSQGGVPKNLAPAFGLRLRGLVSGRYLPGFGAPLPSTLDL